MEQGKHVKRWERTQTTNLWKLASTGGYYARVKVGGKEKWKSLKTNLSSIAKLRLADFEREQRQRAFATQAPTDTSDTTGGAFLDHVVAGINWQDKRDSSKKRYSTAAKLLEKTWPQFRSLNVRNITTGMCREWAARTRSSGAGTGEKTRPLSPSSFNQTLAVLRDCLECATSAGAIYSNPARVVTRIAPKKKELVLPSKAQFKGLAGHIRSSKKRFSQQSADMVLFLAFTGARIGECRAATWGDIDAGRNLMRIHGIKTVSSDRWIPLFPNLGELLGEIKTRRASCKPGERIFSTGSCHQALAAACRDTGAPHMTHHDLRHLFATRCIEAGVDIPTVSRWLGHADGGALAMKTYGHLRQEHSQEQAKKVTW